eukprot:m.73193 g.73193  ORF g.73193 m.73193 type:complete len:163 (-) comp12388_c0_seq4:404-892(-)
MDFVPMSRVTARGKNPTEVRRRACAPCRLNAMRGGGLEQSKKVYITGSKRFKTVALEDFDKNDYFELRDDIGNKRPKEQYKVNQRHGDGQAYLHIQRKLAGLFELLDVAEPEGAKLGEQNKEKRLVGTADLIHDMRRFAYSSMDVCITMVETVPATSQQEQL